MLYRDIAYICRETITLDKNHRPKTSYSKEQIYCNVKSIGQSEFYQAQSVGMKPEIKIEARIFDLSDVSHIDYNGKLYKIVRTYQKTDFIEITLTSMIIDNK